MYSFLCTATSTHDKYPLESKPKVKAQLKSKPSTNNSGKILAGKPYPDKDLKKRGGV